MTLLCLFFLADVSTLILINLPHWLDQLKKCILGFKINVRRHFGPRELEKLSQRQKWTRKDVENTQDSKRTQKLAHGGLPF